ncbi:MAG: AEC family transporter [Actinomycetota bacterium]
MTATALGALLVMLAGAGVRRFGVLRREDGLILVRIVLYLTLPALVFLVVLEADLEPSLLLVPVAGWIVHLVMLGGMLLAVRAGRLPRPRGGAIVVSTAVGNTGFFGIPLIAASGAGFSVAAAVMYDALSTGIITWTSTVAVASAMGEASDVPRVDWGKVGRALLLPPMWALAAGLAFNLSGVHELPRVVERPFEILSGAVLPLVMVYAGLMIDVRGLRHVWRDVAAISVVRLVVAAGVGLAVALALGFEDSTLHTVVVMAAMPTAMMSLVLGGQFRLRADIIAGAVAVTTLLATVTLPALRAVIS